MIPDRLPRLARGWQPPYSGAVCAEQAVAWLISGRLDLGRLSDHPRCVQPVLNALSIVVNDTLSEAERHRMWPLILAQPGTARPEMEPMLSIRLGLWCARQVEHRGPPETKWANDAAEVWCKCPCDVHAREAGDAAKDADRTRGACLAAEAAAAVATAAARASWEEEEQEVEDLVADAVQAAKSAAWATGSATGSRWSSKPPAAHSDALIDLLAGAQAEHARITGHVPPPVDFVRIERLGELVGWAP